MATTHSYTDADLLKLPKDGRKYELVDGEIRVSPAGGRHEKVGARLVARLLPFVDAHGLGHVFGSSMGYRLPGGNVRSPDVSLVAKGRFPDEIVPEGFAELAPDLAVEIVSPEDRLKDVLQKVGEYLDAGVRRVWVIDPRRRRASTYRSLTEVREMGEDGALDGDDVIPGFRCPLADLLA